MSAQSISTVPAAATIHPRWVRICHWINALAILVMISTALIGGWVIAPAMSRLRSSSASGSDLHPPHAEQFRKLHGASLFLTRAGLLAALVALILS